MQGIFSVGLHELTAYKGRFDKQVVLEIQKALLWALDLEQLSSQLAAS